MTSRGHKDRQQSVTVTSANRVRQLLEPRPRSLRTRLAVWLVLTGLLTYLFGVGNFGFVRLINLNAEESKLASRERWLTQEVIELDSEIRFLKTDTLYIEKVARERYELSHPDEIVYRFSSSSSGPYHTAQGNNRRR